MVSTRWSVGAFALVAMVASGCFASNGVRGSGKVETATREVKVFDRVSAASGINLDLKVGAQSVVVEADDNILPLVETVVTDGELRVRFAERNLSTESDVVVHIQVPALSEVSVSGGSKAKGEVAQGTPLELNASGGGQIKLKGVSTAKLSADGSGGARFELEGKAAQLRLALSGGAAMRGAKLQTERVEIAGSGGCAAQVQASEAVRGDLTGGCALAVDGKATVRVRASGGSTVDEGD